MLVTFRQKRVHIIGMETDREEWY